MSQIEARAGHVPIVSASTLAAAAREWAALGAHIFPLQPLSKKPYPSTNGFLDARASARPWDDGEPHNIGFLPASLGLVAVDVDKPEHWEDARRWGLLAQPTFEVETPNGRHFYFRGLAPANGCPVDSLIIRAARGYTVLPPSATADGVYRAHGTPEGAIALPPAFADRLAHEATTDGARQRVRSVFSARRISEGDRHPTLCTLAGHLAARGVSEEYGLELVHAWNAQYCDPPKDAREVTRLVSDIYRKEMADRAANASHVALLSVDPLSTPRRAAPKESNRQIRQRILGRR